MESLSPKERWIILGAAIAGLLFDGVELGLMPIASLSVTEDLMGDQYTAAAGGDWFARYTAALMLGAAIGGIAIGNLGDIIGRSRALGVSILFYSVFAGLGAFVKTQDQMLLLRFLVGLGVGGVWPNAVSLASECWPDKSRPLVAGLMGAALNSGVLLLSQIALYWHITSESWRWIFFLAAFPTLLGLTVLVVVPESPRWRGVQREGASQQVSKKGGSLWDLFRPPLLRFTLIGIALGAIPLVGAWAASKWMIPWADKVAGSSYPGYKGMAQGSWAIGAVLGSFCGAQIAAYLGRRTAYATISIAATLATLLLFLGTQPLQPSFLPLVFIQGFVVTLYFGWLPLYLPELFPTRVRAAGSGIAYNVGRFATAVGVFLAGLLFAWLGGSYPAVGASCGLIYALGILAIFWAPDTSKLSLDREDPV
jgi:SHS family sialic acid transporter-like MFS transporter